MTYDDGEIIRFQGMANFMTFLRETPEAFQFIEQRVMARINGQDIDALAVDAETDRAAIEDIMKEDVEIPEKIVVKDEIPMEA